MIETAKKAFLCQESETTKLRAINPDVLLKRSRKAL
jgi:hypothetical protein